MSTTMLKRQLKDIQVRAESLLKNNPDRNELETFSGYNSEVKSYLLSYTNDRDILKLIEEIPDIMEVENETRSYPILLLAIVGLLTLGISALYLSYVASMREDRMILQNIQIARGKYASIEFLLKAKGDI